MTLKASPEDLRQYRLDEERKWYLSVDGFLDYVRDSGAAPDAQLQPHGYGAHSILNWTKEPDPQGGRDIYKYKLQLWPRGSFKSAVFDVGMSSWEIARNPNIRVLVCSETGKQAKKFVQQSMALIDSQWFRERFGVHQGKQKWQPGTGSFTSALRTDKHTKEATLQSAGAGEVWTGSHWDLVIMDDVVSQENTRTPEALENMRFWFGEILAQLDPGCRLLMIGTLHHYADLYCQILKDPEMKALFELSIHSWQNEDGSLFFPGRITEKFVDQQRKLMPSRLFACFYENKPTTKEQQIFHPEYFHVIENEDIPSHVWTYIFTDFAFIAEEKKKGKTDRTAFWIVSLDNNRAAYVRDFYVGRWKPSDSVRIACDLWNRYQHLNLKGLCVEDTTHKELLSSLFEEVRRQVFIRPRIITVAGRSQEIKDIRIESLEPRFKRGDIYFARSLKENPRKWKPLIDEMTEWPFSAHDDIPDALSDIDKKDKDGRYICPEPPPGWRAPTAIRHVPNMVDGRYNPERSYPAREFIKADQQRGANDLWQRSSQGKEGPTSPGGDIWRRRRESPSSPDRFW